MQTWMRKSLVLRKVKAQKYIFQEGNQQIYGAMQLKEKFC